DVGVGDVVVGDPAHPAVADRGLGQQVVDVGLHLRAVRGHRGAISPGLDHIELVEGVDHDRDRGVELGQVDVAVAHHRQLPGGDPGDVLGRLVGADIDAAGEHRQGVAAQDVPDL